MSVKPQTVRLAQTCCPHCHLLTRADFERCLHCRKHLRESSQERLSPNGRHVDGQNSPAGPPQ
jgi:hypothetical protein